MTRRAPTSTITINRAIAVDGVRRSLPHISVSALARVMAYVKENDIHDMPSTRSTYRKIRDASLPDTPYGKMMLSLTVTLKSGGKRDLVALNPLGYLWTAYKRGGGFHHMFSKLLESCQCSVEKPLRLVV